ncbi:helix-turn-helix domain-containing protein [Streptomyces sp. T-3]|nr:helix-turn-helix domain-containing protein [Streptomyces sp. T-3]
MRGTDPRAAQPEPETGTNTREDNQQLSQLLKEARTRAGLTQEQLAGLSTVSVRAIRDLELGRVQRPRKDTIRLLADAMRLSGPRRAALEMSTGSRSVADALKKVYNTEPAAPPVATGPFVGRGPHLRAITELLGTERERFVSIVGGMGVGKTRLALEATRVLHRRHQTPIVWVPMGGSVNSLEGRSQQMLANWVRELVNDCGPFAEIPRVIDGRPTLLVLDGLEKTDSVKSALLQLLHSSTRLSILVTTRDPELGLGGRVLPLAPLALPADSQPADLPEQPALHLMMSYLRYLRPEILPTESVVATMSRVCQALDGIPLALESAATWLSVYAPHQLLEAAQRSPVMLTEPVSDPGSALGLRRSMEHTIARLSPQHGALLRTLAGYEGAWTVDTVARRTPGNAAEVGRGVHALLLRGLICPIGAEESRADAVSRFSVLNLVKHLVAAERRAQVPVTARTPAAVSATASVERAATPICAI